MISNRYTELSCMVERSINSDINNLLSILKVWQVLPKGKTPCDMRSLVEKQCVAVLAATI